MKRPRPVAASAMRVDSTAAIPRLRASGYAVAAMLGEFAAFDAEVGVQAQPTPQPGSVVFQVLVDGEKRLDSGVRRQADTAKPVHVSLDGAQEMELVVAEAGDGINCDVANWANARLTRAAGAEHRGTLDRLNISPFARVMTWDPKQTGSHPGRVQELSEEQIFLGRDVAPNDDGGYVAPVWEDGVLCVGLQWYENRYVTEVAFRTQTVTDGAVRVQWWVGESEWQGDWKDLRGEIEREGNRLVFRIDRRDLWSASSGVQKVRWLIEAEGQPVKVRELEAYTGSRIDTAEVRLERHAAERDGSASVEVYNGEVADGRDNAGPAQLPWELAEPLTLKLRYCRPRKGMSKADRTVLRLRLPEGAFGIAVDDVVEHGCVHVPDFGVFAALVPDGPSFEEHQQELTGRQTILERVRSLPDQSFVQAMAHVHRPIQDRGPTMLSLACDNHKFTVHEDGEVEHRFDPEIGPDGDRRRAVASPVRVLEITPQFGSGAARVGRGLEGGWLPVVVSTYREGEVDYRQRSFVVPAGRSLSGDVPWLNKNPLFVSELAVENASAQPASAALRQGRLRDHFARGRRLPRVNHRPAHTVAADNARRSPSPPRGEADGLGDRERSSA